MKPKRHRWSDAGEHHKACRDCGLLKIHRHTSHHWIEWRWRGEPIMADTTPPCPPQGTATLPDGEKR